MLFRAWVPMQKALNTINFSLLFMEYLENYRIFIIPNLGVLYILQNTETSRIPLVSRLLPVLFRQSPTSWYSIKAQIKTSCSIKIPIIKLNNIKYFIKTAKTLAFRGCHVVSLYFKPRIISKNKKETFKPKIKQITQQLKCYLCLQI